MADIQIDENTRLAFQQLLKEAMTDGTIVGNFIQSMFSYDTTSLGGNNNNKLEESEIETFFEKMISAAIDKYYKDNVASKDTNSITKGAKLTGISSGSQFLSTYHHHKPSEIDPVYTTDKDGKKTVSETLNVDVLPQIPGSKVTDLDNSLYKSDKNKDSPSDISAGHTLVNETTNYWNNVPEGSREISFCNYDGKGHVVGKFVSYVNSDGSVQTGIEAFNQVGNGTSMSNGLYTIVKKTDSGTSRAFGASDVNAFYRGIKPLPSHMGILYGSNTNVSAPEKGATNTHTVTFDPSSSSNNNVSTFKFTEAPIVIVCVNANNDSGSHITASVKSSSQTNFTYRLYCDADGSPQVNVNWIAIGNCSF